MKCVLCGEKALFKVRKKGFCAAHREAAERERIALLEKAESSRRAGVERFHSESAGVRTDR
jgi:hypothetical protein